ALNWYGPALGLPHAMAGTNSFWYRGYDPHEPQTVILVGLEKEEAETNFVSCAVAAKNTNRYGVENEESRDHQDIYLCRGLKGTWSEFWKKFRRYGGRRKKQILRPPRRTRDDKQMAVQRFRESVFFADFSMPGL